MSGALAVVRPSVAVCVLLALAACGGEGGGDPLPGSGRGTSGQDRPVEAGPEETPILFQGARIVVGDGTVHEEGELLIRGDRIVDVGPTGSVDRPEDARVIDVGGFTIIPALIDGHAHLGYQGPDDWSAGNYGRANLVDNLNRYAFYGFGAVFSAGSDPLEPSLQLQRAQERGEVGGARFLFAAGMAPPGEGPNPAFLREVLRVAERTGDPIVRGAGSPAEGRAAVVEVAELGVGVVKIWVDDRGGSQTKMAPEIYRAILDQAAVNGIQVFVHQQDASDMPDLVDAGADGFLHGRLGPGIDDALADRMADDGVFVVPNLGLGELRGEDVGSDPFLRESLAPDVATRLTESWRARQGGGGAESDAESDGDPDRETREALARLMRAGVPVVLGTDAGGVPDHFFGYTGHRELEIFVRLGMTPEEALESATATAAAQLGLDDAGSLEEGKRADFVVLRFDPLQDIRNTRSIASVYLGGQRVDRDSLRSAWTEP